jgi:hypothetical protein
MAETYTAEDLQASTNGHASPSRDETLRAIANIGSERDFVTRLIAHMRQDPYPGEMLYESAFLQRCARIKREHFALYKGKLFAAIKQTGGLDAWEWDSQVDITAYAHDRLPTVPLSSIPDEEVRWLWEPYVPLNKLTLVEGDPEAGKTYILLALSAAVTRGFHLPDQHGKVQPAHGTCGNVLYITAEDGLGDTIKKRARLCKADLDRIFVVPSDSMFHEAMQPFSLARPHLLSAAIEERQASLVILDPLTAFLGAEVDMHRANEVRPLMTILGGLATKHACAMVAIRHWTKAVGGKAAYRGQGNIDFRAAARSVLAIGESPEDERQRIMAQSKSSNNARGVSMVFEISDLGLTWAGTSLMTADELSAAQPQRHKKQRKDAMEWLKDALKSGPQSVSMLRAAAEALNIAPRTLDRAKEALHVLSTKEGTTWYWRLPTFQKWERYPGMEDDD